MTNPVTYIEGFVSFPETWFERLWNELEWERRPDAPRREYWTNTLHRDYTYGRGAGVRTYASRNDHPVIEAGRKLLQARDGTLFEGCFLNAYEGARDWLGWHADDDPGIDHSKPIAVITLYPEGTKAFRSIEYRQIVREPSKGDKGEFGPTVALPLANGSLFLMNAGMQSTHQHRIPKAGFEASPRISMTYRGLVAA